MKKELRYYQSDCVTEIKKSWHKGGYPYANCCPASGKSLILAELTEWALKKGGRVLQLVPKLEHVNQNYEETFNYVDKKFKGEIGVCNAKLNKFHVRRKCVIATASSFLSRRASSGAFNVILIDECHNVSNETNSGYRKIIRSLQRLNPKVMIAGVSGSPYRMGQGLMHNDCIKGKALFTELVYETDIKTMIDEGYLCHLESISGDISIDTHDLKVKGQDYDTTAMGVKFDAICEDAVADIKQKIAAHDIKTGILFCSNVANAEKVTRLLGHDIAKVLHGGIAGGERKRIIQWLENGSGVRIVVNPNILCEGYNFPALDMVGLLRATKSLRLYVQMICRAIRASNGKAKGFIIDYGSNIERHGAIDQIEPPKPKKRREDAPRKICDIVLDRDCVDKKTGEIHQAGYPCYTDNPLSAKKCRVCGAHFVTENEAGDYAMRSHADVLALKDKKKNEGEYFDVERVGFQPHNSFKSGILMIKMSLVDKDDNLIHNEFLCLNHKGGAREKAGALLRLILKDVKDYYKLGTVGTSVENILPLLRDDYDNFFKKIMGVTIRPQAGNAKYKEIKSLRLE